MRRKPDPLICSLCIHVKKQDCYDFKAANWPGLWMNQNTTGFYVSRKTLTTQIKSPRGLRILALHNSKLPWQQMPWWWLVLVHTGRDPLTICYWAGNRMDFWIQVLQWWKKPPRSCQTQASVFSLAGTVVWLNPCAFTPASSAALALPVCLPFSPGASLPLFVRPVKWCKALFCGALRCFLFRCKHVWKTPSMNNCCSKTCCTNSACAPLFWKATHTFIKNKCWESINLGWDHAASGPLAPAFPPVAWGASPLSPAPLFPSALGGGGLSVSHPSA